MGVIRSTTKHQKVDILEFVPSCRTFFISNVYYNIEDDLGSILITLEPVKNVDQTIQYEDVKTVWLKPSRTIALDLYTYLSSGILAHRVLVTTMFAAHLFSIPLLYICTAIFMSKTA